MADEILLGFGMSPKRRSVYINRQYGCLWYFWNGQESNHIPIEESDLYCILESIEIRTGEYKGKPVEKVHLMVKADQQYRLIAGIETAFVRTVIESLRFRPLDFSRPISIVLDAGDDEAVIFGRVFQEGTVRMDDADRPQLKGIEQIKQAIDWINGRLGAPSTGKPDGGLQQPTQQPQPQPQTQRQQPFAPVSTPL